MRESRPDDAVERAVGTPSRPDAVAVRTATPADIGAIHRIERASFADPWSRPVLERHLGAAAFLVAHADGDVVGFVVATAVPTGHVRDLAVHPDARRAGVGRRLLTAALARIADAGADAARLEVRRSNGAAVALYRTLGFRYDHRVAGYYPDGEDALVFVSRLGDA